MAAQKDFKENDNEKGGWNRESVATSKTPKSYFLFFH
jgi:hypothetical protein